MTWQYHCLIYWSRPAAKACMSAASHFQQLTPLTDRASRKKGREASNLSPSLADRSSLHSDLLMTWLSGVGAGDNSAWCTVCASGLSE